jgi:phage gpG-like protein
MAEFNRIKVPCQDAMADRVYEIVDSNIGDTGKFRPHEWAALSEKYAKRVGRTHATLHLTGELRSSVDMAKGSPEASAVFTNSPIAVYHQNGTEKMPDRPFFPIANGEVTDEAVAECLKVCEATIKDMQ